MGVTAILIYGKEERSSREKESRWGTVAQIWVVIAAASSDSPFLSR
jgi:hypothetical protein